MNATSIIKKAQEEGANPLQTQPEGFSLSQAKRKKLAQIGVWKVLYLPENWRFPDEYHRILNAIDKEYMKKLQKIKEQERKLQEKRRLLEAQYNEKVKLLQKEFLEEAGLEPVETIGGW